MAGLFHDESIIFFLKVFSSFFMTMIHFCRGKYDICGPEKSVAVAALYEDLRYETFNECLNPCIQMKVHYLALSDLILSWTQMKVSTHYKYKVQNQDKQSVMIIFPTEVESSVETVTKSLFSTGKLTLSF